MLLTLVFRHCTLQSGPGLTDNTGRERLGYWSGETGTWNTGEKDWDLGYWKQRLGLQLLESETGTGILDRETRTSVTLE